MTHGERDRSPALQRPDAPGAAASALPSGRPSVAAAPPPCRLTLLTGEGLELTEAHARALTDALATAERRDLSVARADRALAAAVPALAGSRRSVAAALRSPAALTCVEHSPRPTRTQPLTASGLTRAAAQLRTDFEAAFGRSPLGGFAAGGVSTGHVDNSAHYEGRAIDVTMLPRSARQTARGWLRAHWLVAHAGELSLLSVIWQDHIWTDWASEAGWRDYVHPGGPTTDPTLRHLDHIHMAVVGVRPTPRPGPST